MMSIYDYMHFKSFKFVVLAHVLPWSEVGLPIIIIMVMPQTGA